MDTKLEKIKSFLQKLKDRCEEEDYLPAEEVWIKVCEKHYISYEQFIPLLRNYFELKVKKRYGSAGDFTYIVPKLLQTA